MTEIVDDFRLPLRGKDYIPIVIGAMGVDISTADMALEAARLGGIGHISDAMSLHMADRELNTRFTTRKAKRHAASADSLDKTAVRFDLEDLYQAQRQTV